jgi:hypothetical protein
MSSIYTHTFCLLKLHLKILVIIHVQQEDLQHPTSLQLILLILLQF